MKLICDGISLTFSPKKFSCNLWCVPVIGINCLHTNKRHFIRLPTWNCKEWCSKAKPGDLTFTQLTKIKRSLGCRGSRCLCMEYGLLFMLTGTSQTRNHGAKFIVKNNSSQASMCENEINSSIGSVQHDAFTVHFKELNTFHWSTEGYSEQL